MPFEKRISSSVNESGSIDQSSGHVLDGQAEVDLDAHGDQHGLGKAFVVHAIVALGQGTLPLLLLWEQNVSNDQHTTVNIRFCARIKINPLSMCFPLFCQNQEWRVHDCDFLLCRQTPAVMGFNYHDTDDSVSM